MLRQDYIDRNRLEGYNKSPLYITLDDHNADKRSIWIGHLNEGNLIRLSANLEASEENDAKILKAYQDIVAILRSIN